ncbi:MAG: hypothetical protein ACK4NS_13830, partial [Saprospiraceae bacterium]
LQLNGVNLGNPLAGTGDPLTFGNFNQGGTYTVVATSSAGCTAQMSGTASVSAVACSATIQDPCVCLNNATTLTNGQFGEVIIVNAPVGQTWTVVSASGLFATNSPAPPFPPIGIAPGTVLTPLGGGQYRLEGRHTDDIGYSVSVTNGQGTTLTISNKCAYPNPAITSDLGGPFCLGS